MDQEKDDADARDRGIPELIESSLEGDVAALSAVVSRFQNSVLKQFLALGCSREDAEDLTQETLVEAVEHLSEYRPETGRFRSWLFGIGYMLYRDRSRRAQRHRRRQREYEEQRSRFWDEYLREHCRLAPETDPLAEVWDSLTFLPERDRLLMHLRFVEDLSIDEIGRVIGLGGVAVRMRIHRALHRIRRRLESRGRVHGAES